VILAKLKKTLASSTIRLRTSHWEHWSKVFDHVDQFFVKGKNAGAFWDLFVEFPILRDLDGVKLHDLTPEEIGNFWGKAGNPHFSGMLQLFELFFGP
jgi:hypothetical protein